MKQFATENRYFLGAYLIFLVMAGLVIFKFEKGDEIIYFNNLHTPFFNTFFKWVTRLAEPPFLILIMLFTFFRHYGKGLLLALNFALVFIAIQLLKQLAFAGEVRPSVFFEGRVTLHFIEGMQVLRQHSFPSGHSAGGFALFFMLSILSGNKKWGLGFFALALLVGVSRIYLLQHFLRDVYFGSLVAVAITAIFWLTFGQSKLYHSLPWKDRALLK